MRPLPLSLWLLITAQIDALAQAHAAEPQTQTQQKPLPTAVRKMPPDQGAKFHHSYYAFPDDPVFAATTQHHKTPAALAARRIHEADDALLLASNASIELPLRPPFAVLSGQEEEQNQDQGYHRPRIPPWDLFRRAASALALLEKRQWACPSGTTSCASIGFPNSCCQQGETCVEVPDTGLGPVGCCPAGATCGGGVSGCAEGSTACGSEIGGGCCIPGWVCEGVGCVRPAPSSTPLPSLTTLTTTSTSVIPLPTPSTILITVVITITPSSTPSPRTSTITQTHTASPNPSNSNPDAGAPLRPTSSPVDSPNPTDTDPSSTNTYCPTGFYPCLAVAHAGGCCQTGRDCATMSCPPLGEMTTIVNANGVTVVVPKPTSLGPSEGKGDKKCASGWFLCSGDNGGEGGDGGEGEAEGCCPSGYTCGKVSCSVVVEGGSATAEVAKGLPTGESGSERVKRGWRVMVGVCAGVVMFGLV